MKRIAYLIACAFLLVFTGCQNRNGENTFDSNLNSIPDTSISYTDLSGESSVGSGGYFSYTNFVKKQDSGEYELILDELEYNGGEFDIDVEFCFDARGEKIGCADALAFLFVDGYMQEFSLDNDEKALIHKITIQNNTLSYINYKCVLKTYDDSADKHTICTVILPYWETGMGNFIRDTAVMAKTREIKLNVVNKPEENNVIQMCTREITDWDLKHSELPFKRSETETDLIFHCFNIGKTCCYVFCNGELVYQYGKHIFTSNNSDSETISFQNISVNSSDVGKPLFVLYIPKDTDNLIIERTCNYLWEKSE